MWVPVEGERVGVDIYRWEGRVVMAEFPRQDVCEVEGDEAVVEIAGGDGKSTRVSIVSCEIAERLT